MIIHIPDSSPQRHQFELGTHNGWGLQLQKRLQWPEISFNVSLAFPGDIKTENNGDEHFLQTDHTGECFCNGGGLANNMCCQSSLNASHSLSLLSSTSLLLCSPFLLSIFSNSTVMCECVNFFFVAYDNFLSFQWGKMGSHRKDEHAVTTSSVQKVIRTSASMESVNSARRSNHPAG